MLLDQDLTLLSLKVWSYSGDYPATHSGQASIYQEARDVAVANDGSIYVVGVVSGGFTFAGTTHCFLLRLDENLNRNNARSFGVSGKVLTCNSLQLTRNADYMYVGGIMQHTRSSLFFAKMDSRAQSIIATSLEHSSSNFGFRRIIKENNKAFSGTDDQHTVYFCGFYYDGTYKGDMVYGHFTSTSLTSISLKLVFQYGSTANEFTHTSSNQVSHSFGDCTLTEDNAYLLGVFSTSYQSTRPSTASESISYGTPTTPNEPFTSAGVSSGTCNEIDDATLENYFITYSQTPAVPATTFNGASIIADWCETTMKNQLNTYVNNYANMNSWRSCTPFIFNFHNIQCSVSRLKFGSCDTRSWSYGGTSVTGLYRYGSDEASCGTGGCMPSSCKSYGCGLTKCTCNQPVCDNFSDCCQQCAAFRTTYNYYQWWYTSVPPCADWQFRTQVYNTPADSIGTRSSYDPFLFCEQVASTCYAGATPSYNGKTYIQDKIYLSFEQDCASDSTGYESLFVFRIDLQTSKYGAAVAVTSYPDAAVYFGDRGGRTYGHTIAVDEYGYIYVQGQSSASAFGGSGTRYSWLHVKTHWELTHELQCDRRTTYCSDPSPGYMGKRWVRPKSFTGASFSKLLFNAASFVAATWRLQAFSINGYPMYEDTVDLLTGTDNAFKLHTYKTASGDWISNNILYAVSHSRMSPIQTIRIRKSAVSSRNYTFSLPMVCLAFEVNFDSSSGVGAKKVIWDTKYFTFTNPYNFASGTRTSMGLTITGVNGNTLPILPAELYHLSGLLGAATSPEGVYYLEYRSSTHYKMATKSNTYKCDLPDYGYFMNDMTLESLRRYESSLRVKIVIDDISIDAPQIKLNINDIKPTVGYQYFFTLTSGVYFTGCDRYKVRRALYTTSSSSSGSVQSIKSHMLPQWVMFHEKNSSFVIYPESTSIDAHIEVACCNVISQCITNTFQILPQNTKPVSAISAQSKTYILQLDGTIGQTFTWAKNIVSFYDLDKAVTLATDSLYDSLAINFKNLNHTVIMDFPTPLTFFRSIYQVGMLFGQATTANYLATQASQSIEYQYYDEYSTSAKQTGTLNFIINTMPVVTTIGKAYTFPTIDPSNYTYSSTYFDSYFPFLSSELEPKSINIGTSTWFSSSQTMVHSLNRSDGTALPDWIRYSQSSGEMILEPPSKGISELVQLKFKVIDSYQGWAQTYKTILLNTQPTAKQIYKVLLLFQGRQFTYDLNELIEDKDGDPLVFTFSKASDETKLNKNGLYLNSVQSRLTGNPEFPSVYGLMTIIATDTHGYYTTVYLTIKIEDFRVKYRKGKYRDVTIYEYRPFTSSLDDSILYDGQDSSTLVLFASTQADLSLPEWLNFDPVSRTFYGSSAPNLGTVQMVRIRAMNQKSHDSQSSDFKITVIGTAPPKTTIEYLSYDFIVEQSEWFERTLPLQVFNFSRICYNISYRATVVQFSGETNFTTYIELNEDNRTIYGKSGKVEGVYRMDIVFIDDWMRETLMNIKITVKPSQQTFYIKNLPLIVISICSLLGLIVYFVYLFHWVRLSNDSKFRKAYKRGLLKHSKERFKDYQDVRVQFIRTIIRDDESPIPETSKTNTSVSSYAPKGYASVPQDTAKHMGHEHSFSFFQPNDYSEAMVLPEQSTMLMTSRPLPNTSMNILYHDDNDEDEAASKDNDQVDDLVMPPPMFILPPRVNTPISSNIQRMLTPSSNHKSSVPILKKDLTPEQSVSNQEKSELQQYSSNGNSSMNRSNKPTLPPLQTLALYHSTSSANSGKTDPNNYYMTRKPLFSMKQTVYSDDDVEGQDRESQRKSEERSD